MKACIITNGKLEDISILEQECAASDVVICADGGARFAKKAGVIPDYLIGDFDSIEPDTLEHFKGMGVRLETYPAEKDYTDTEICIAKAIELGCDQICIIAGIGGRLDHTLGNIGLLHIMEQKHVKGWIAGEEANIHLCSGYGMNELELHGVVGTTVSLIPFMGNVDGVTLEGLKYPLKDALIEFGRPIGISNEMVSDQCRISLRRGELLVIVQHKTE